MWNFHSFDERWLGVATALSQARVLIFCVEFWELSHLTHDLSQAEKKITVVTS
jgi:hypothetical protein